MHHTPSDFLLSDLSAALPAVLPSHAKPFSCLTHLHLTNLDDAQVLTSRLELPSTLRHLNLDVADSRQYERASLALSHLQFHQAMRLESLSLGFYAIGVLRLLFDLPVASWTSLKR